MEENEPNGFVEDVNIGLKMLQGEIFGIIGELSRNIINIDDLTGLML